MVFEPNQRGLLKHFGIVGGLGVALAGATVYYAALRPAARLIWPSDDSESSKK